MSVPKPAEQSINLVFGSIVLSVGAVFLFSFVLYLAAGPDVGFLVFLVTLPGRFLFLSFHYAGLFVPVYLSAAAGLLLLNRVRLKTVFALHLGLLPFFSSAIGLRLLLDPNAQASAAPRIVAEALTPLGGAITALLTTVVLLVLIVRFMRAPVVLPGRAARGTNAVTAAEAEVAYESEWETAAEHEVMVDLAAPDDFEDSVPEEFRDPSPEVAGYAEDEQGTDELESSKVEEANRYSFERLDEVDDGHQPLHASSVLLGPRIAELLRNQVAPTTKPIDTYGGEREPLSENTNELDEELDDVDDELEEIDLVLDEDDELVEIEDALDGDDIDEIEDDIELDLDEDDVEDEISDDLPKEEDAAVFLFRRRDSEIGRSFSIVQDGTDDETVFDESREAPAVIEPEPAEEAARTALVREEKKPGPRSGRAAARSKRIPYNVPVDGLLEHYSDGGYWEIDDETRKAGELLRVTLEEFQIQAEVTGIRKGPVITMFELLPAPGVKLAKITNLADNIALRLAASSVRIVAPIPGKHAVGIEIPNKRRNIVSFGELLREENFTESDMAIPLAIGKDIPGDAQIIDLARTPHLLIAGATGSGKSVCVNSIICSVLYRRAPNEVKLILIDPKIVELKFYNDIPHLLTPVITDPKRAFQALQWCIYEMERRYSLLDSLGVRDIRSFNAKVKKREIATEKLPYIVVVVDEFADLMATSGKELESTLARLAAMSRAVGIHLVLATQRPSTDVITGLIKANIPSRIAFMVASKVDSRIIIDSVGAEKLLGKGDMLFTSAWDPFPFRIQGAFLSEDEVERVVAHVKTLGEPEYIDDEIFIEEDDDDVYQDELEDPLLEKAINIVVGANKASASYLQRRLKIGYNRAARLVEEMERLGIVGPQNGSKARDILHVPEQVG